MPQTIEDTQKSALLNLRISEDIGAEMTDQAAIFARYAFLAAEAEDRYLRMKLALELEEARLDKIVRTKMIQNGDKIREAAVESAIKSEQSWQKLNDAVLRDKLAMATMDAATESFRMRAQMLSGLGAMRRAEIEQSNYLGTPTSESKRQRSNEALKKQFLDNTRSKQQAVKP